MVKKKKKKKRSQNKWQFRNLNFKYYPFILQKVHRKSNTLDWLFPVNLCKRKGLGKYNCALSWLSTLCHTLAIQCNAAHDIYAVLLSHFYFNFLTVLCSHCAIARKPTRILNLTGRWLFLKFYILLWWDDQRHWGMKRIPQIKKEVILQLPGDVGRRKYMQLISWIIIPFF